MGGAQADEPRGLLKSHPKKQSSLCLCGCLPLGLCGLMFLWFFGKPKGSHTSKVANSHLSQSNPTRAEGSATIPATHSLSSWTYNFLGRKTNLVVNKTTVSTFLSNPLAGSFGRRSLKKWSPPPSASFCGKNDPAIGPGRLSGPGQQAGGFLLLLLAGGFAQSVGSPDAQSVGSPDVQSVGSVAKNEVWTGESQSWDLTWRKGVRLVSFTRATKKGLPKLGNTIAR